MTFQIIEKPESISWEDIHNLLWKAHAENRDKGITMLYPSLSGEEIRQRIEGKGKMFCAIANGKLVGTAAIVAQKVKFWFNKTPEIFAYQCFAAVLPEFEGTGIYKQLMLLREKESQIMGNNCLTFDTHVRNTHVISINKVYGYKPVDYKFYKDHYNVVMVKWINGCPYSNVRCKYEFLKRYLFVKTKHIVGSLYHKQLK